MQNKQKLTVCRWCLQPTFDEMGTRQSKRPQRPPRPKAYLRFDDFEVLRAIGRGAFGKVSKAERICTVMDKSQTGCPILYCKSIILRVGVWPIWVGTAHSPLGQLTLYTSSLTYSKMSCFQWVLLKIQQFEFLRGQFWFILVLSGKLEKCNWLPFQNYSSKIAHFWGC